MSHRSHNSHKNQIPWVPGGGGGQVRDAQQGPRSRVARRGLYSLLFQIRLGPMLEDGVLISAKAAVSTASGPPRRVSEANRVGESIHQPTGDRVSSFRASLSHMTRNQVSGQQGDFSVAIAATSASTCTVKWLSRTPVLCTTSAAYCVALTALRAEFRGGRIVVAGRRSESLATTVATP